MCGHHRHHRHHHRTTAGSPERTSTIPVDDVRASDAERDEVVSALRTHAGDGRLTVDELSDRIDVAHAAQTRRELAALLSDLPRQRRTRPRRDARAEFGEHLRTYLSVMALLVVIWALTGMGYFWPIWPAVGWGFFIFSHASAVRRPRAHRVRTG